MTSHLFEYALNTLWQLPLLAAATWLLIRLTRPSTLTQHTLWIATLALAAILPLRGIIPVPHSSTVVSSMSGSASTASALPSHSPTTVLLTPHLILRIAQIWTLAFAFNLFRLACAWLAARRLIAAAQPLTPESLDPHFLQTIAARLAIPTPEIRLLPAASTPVVAGILHPVLLLPSHLAHDYELAAVLLHEFAHIRRRDTLINLCCRLIALPIAWHPVTPLLQTRITQTREILCDALAAEALGSPTAYARSLLTLARDLQRHAHQPALTQGLFPSIPNSSARNSSALEERIMKLITPPASQPISSHPTHRAARLATGVALVLSATPIASAFHLRTASAATSPREASFRNAAQQPLAALSPSPSNSPSLVSSRGAAEGPASRLLSIPTDKTSAPTQQTAPPAPPAPPAPESSIAPPAPQAPAPAPAPAPTPHSITKINGVQRDLTLEEQASLDAKLAKVHDQVEAALKNVHIDQAQLKAQLKTFNQAHLDRQMAEIRKQLDSPEFQRQIAEAQQQAADHAINNAELRAALTQASAQLKIASAQIAAANIHIDPAAIQAQVKAATDALAHTRIPVNIHIDTAQIQRQLDHARRQVEDAQKNLPTPQP